MSYVIFRAQTDIALGLMKAPTKPTTTDGCTYDFVPLNKTTLVEVEDAGKSLHHMSFLYYSCEKFQLIIGSN